MVLSAFLFASMGVCIKFAAEQYNVGEVVMYRGFIGMALMAFFAHSAGGSLRTAIPVAHMWRTIVGVASLGAWFYSLTGLPVATAMTLNYTSSVWMALFLIGGAVFVGSQRVDWRIVAAVLAGFVGVVLVLRPTIEEQQLWYGVIGLLSGVTSAMAYLQVTTLARAGEPEFRIVFYFSTGSVIGGALIALASGGFSGHSVSGVLLVLAIGVLATGGQLLMTAAYSRGAPLSNACLAYAAIPFAFLYGLVLFRDPFSWMALGGMVLIVASGIAATLLRLRIAPPRRKDPAPYTEPTN